MPEFKLSDDDAPTPPRPPFLEAEAAEEQQKPAAASTPAPPVPRAPAPPLPPAVSSTPGAPRPVAPTPPLPLPQVPKPPAPTAPVPAPQVPTPATPRASTPPRAPAAPAPRTPAAAPSAQQTAASKTPAATRMPPTPRAQSLGGQHAPQQPLAPRAPTPPTPTYHAPSPGLPGATPPAGEVIIDDGNQFSSLRIVMEKLDPVVDWIFRVAIFGTAASLAYLLYAVFAGHIGQSDAAVSGAVANNLHRTATVFQISLILLALSALWLALDMPAIGLALIGVGLALHFGAPIILLGHVGQTKIVASLAAVMQTTGFLLAVIGVLKQGYEVVMWALNLPNRMKQKADVGFAQQAEPAQRRVAREATMFSPCWKLPFCREVIRKQCPAFLAGKTCWKFGRGCYCDEEMIGRIIRGESLEVIKAPTRLSQTGKPPCGRCHIYLEHQGHKYKLLSPLAFPGTAIAMYLIWPIYSNLFSAFMTSNIWNVLNFDSSKLAPDALKTDAANKTVSTLDPDQVAHFATILIGVLVGFFVFVYVSKFIEWAIYKAKM